jgi:hypothetical protein
MAPNGGKAPVRGEVTVTQARLSVAAFFFCDFRARELDTLASIGSFPRRLLGRPANIDDSADCVRANFC